MDKPLSFHSAAFLRLKEIRELVLAVVNGKGCNISIYGTEEMQTQFYMNQKEEVNDSNDSYGDNWRNESYIRAD